MAIIVVLHRVSVPVPTGFDDGEARPTAMMANPAYAPGFNADPVAGPASPSGSHGYVEIRDAAGSSGEFGSTITSNPSAVLGACVMYTISISTAPKIYIALANVVPR